MAPRLIFIDIRMPVMDGVEATRRIKATAEGRDTVIVALTAHALEEERHAILAAGCDDFIRKPYQDTEIFDTLTKHLDVRFAYEEEVIQAAEGQPLLTASVMAELSAPLLNELEQALVLLDMHGVDRVIEEVRAQYPVLAEALAVDTRELQYGRIPRVIKGIRGGRANR
jgi:CheY-like chemotaxis protein